MAHHSMFDPDPANPAEDPRSEGERQFPAGDGPDRLDLVELVEKFTLHGGGRVSAQVSADLALDLVLNQIAEQACLATPASGAAIVLARDGEWVCRASAGSNSPNLGARLDAEAGLSGECIKTREIQRCDDAQSDPRADVEACRSLGVRSVLILPLLQYDELMGVFEVFSSQPAAFGNRDESTLQVLSQRVLTSLKQTSQPLPLSAEASTPEPAIVSDEGLNNPVTETPSAEGSLDNAIAEDFAAKHDVAKDSERTSASNNRFEDAPISEATGEVAGRGINILTWMLGGAVLAFALLLTASMGLRLLRGKSASRAHPPTDTSAKTSDAGRNRAPNATTETASSGTKGKGKEPKANLAAANRTGAAGPPNSSEATDVTAASTTSHLTSVPPTPGSLQIFEKGKEIFRMSPAAVQGQQSNGGGANGVTSAGSRAPAENSPIERAAIYELSPQAASGSLLHRVEPEYPQEALQQQIQGPVALDVRIARDGTVQTVKLVSGQRLLADAAMAAVKQWRFKPHPIKGQPVEMQTIITLIFRPPR
jgi:TonB family protein